MIVKINGKQEKVTPNSTLQRIITTLTQKPDHVIAEVNGNIIKKPSWHETQIQEGDTIELVSFVGGG